MEECELEVEVHRHMYVHAHIEYIEYIHTYSTYIHTYMGGFMRTTYVIWHLHYIAGPIPINEMLLPYGFGFNINNQ